VLRNKTVVLRRRVDNRDHAPTHQSREETHFGVGFFERTD
jgi:hypothetical protein